MSFTVDWKLLENESISEWTRELLTETLNSGKRPNILAADIEIKDLYFGKVSPDFEMLEIGELEKDRFRGIFKISYLGDAYITLHTKVQANPLKIYNDNLIELENAIGSSTNFINPNFLLSNEEFSIPLDLKLSDICINAIGIIVFSKTKGLTLVFRNDPLDSIKVSSTFDTVQVLANFLQKQIESQIRELFRETLPTVLHRLSLKYVSLQDESLKIFQKEKHSDPADVNLFDGTSDFHYSLENLQTNLNLFNSRETLNLHIPKFRNLIQRCNLGKFNQNISPNLLTSLSWLNNNIDGVRGTNGNGIPINFLVNKDFNNVQDIVKNISNIQTNNFYKSLNNSNVNIKPKRRVIRIHKKKDTVISTPSTSTCVQSPILLSKSISLKNSRFVDPSNDNSEDDTLVDHEPQPQQPLPLKLNMDSIHSRFQGTFSNSPVNTNSSVLNGVGLGNNYFNFTNPDYSSVENPFLEAPSTNQDVNVVQKENEAMGDQENARIKDIGKTIKEKLNQLKKLENDNHKHFYMEMPPPYQV